MTSTVPHNNVNHDPHVSDNDIIHTIDPFLYSDEDDDEYTSTHTNTNQCTINFYYCDSTTIDTSNETFHTNTFFSDLNENTYKNITPEPNSNLTPSFSLSIKNIKYVENETQKKIKQKPKIKTKSKSVTFDTTIDHTDEKFSVNIDRYGFPTTDVMDEKEHRKLIRKENERLNKWQEMIYGNKKGQMSSLSQGIIQIEIDQWNLVKNHRKLKSRIRKGIPQQMRGTIWQNLCGARDRRKIETVRYGSKSLYSDLKNKKKSPYHQQLWKDINRTYRKHASFGLVDVARNNNKNENNGSAKKHKKQKFFKNDIQDSAILITPQDLEMNATEAQMSLYNVLKAFSLYRKDIGYCQGMQSVTALMLMHMTEEEAFWVLASLADDTKYQLENLWRPTMPAIQLRFYQMERMVKLTLPKLAAHFDYHQIISASMYQASQWFITIFLATNMKFPVLLRLWDIYLNEGLKTVYRMGVGLLKYWEKELLKCTFEEMCEFFRTGSSLLEVEEYIRICFSFKITHAHLAAFERDFNRQNKK